MKKIKFVLFGAFLILLLMFVYHSECLAKKAEPAEVYFTSIDAPDPFDKNYQITEAVYDSGFNIIGINFTKSKEVNIYRDDKFLVTKEIEDDQFNGVVNIISQGEETVHIFKIDGEARGESLEVELNMKPGAAIPTWAWIVGILLLIGGVVYYIYRRMFGE